jgi:hypothetical protein
MRLNWELPVQIDQVPGEFVEALAGQLDRRFAKRPVASCDGPCRRQAKDQQDCSWYSSHGLQQDNRADVNNYPKKAHTAK